MPETDETTTTTLSPLKPATPREGFNEKGERVVVTLDSLKKEFGAKEGERLYREIAKLGGFGNWLDLATEQTPPLPVAQLTGDNKGRVDQLFATAVKE